MSELRHLKRAFTSPRLWASEFTLVDLFCGAGGFTEGFLLAGNDVAKYSLVAASDSSSMARQTYEGRFRDQLQLDFEFLLQDARAPSFPSELNTAVKERIGSRGIDVVCGGPPCQGFSVFGARNENDPRNDLPLAYFKAIELLKPAYFVMENVPGIVQMYEGRMLSRLRESVASLSDGEYELVGPLMLNAADYGVPQTRERVVFIGCRSDMPRVDEIPPLLDSTRRVSAGEAIGDLAFLRPWESAETYSEEYPAQTRFQEESRRGRLFNELGIERSDVSLTNHEAARHTPEVIARFSLIRPGEGLESLPSLLWKKHLSTRKKWCVRLDPSKPSYTVVTLPDDLVHPSQPRILTVRELARLQSFDDTFVFRGPRATGGGGAGNKLRSIQVPQYSQVGNAVPPLMAKAIAEQLLGALAEKEESRSSSAVARQGISSGPANLPMNEAASGIRR